MNVIKIESTKTALVPWSVFDSTIKNPGCVLRQPSGYQIAESTGAVTLDDELIRDKLKALDVAHFTCGNYTREGLAITYKGVVEMVAVVSLSELFNVGIRLVEKKNHMLKIFTYSGSTLSLPLVCVQALVERVLDVVIPRNANFSICGTQIVYRWPNTDGVGR